MSVINQAKVELACHVRCQILQKKLQAPLVSPSTKEKVIGKILSFLSYATSINNSHIFLLNAKLLMKVGMPKIDGGLIQHHPIMFLHLNMQVVFPFLC